MENNTREKKMDGEQMPNQAQEAEKAADNNINVDSSENTLEKKSAVKNGIVRMVLVLVSILLEVIVIFLLLHYLGSKAGWVYSVIHILSIILVLVIYGSHKTASIKMTWIMLIMLLPIVGTVLFLIIGLNWHTLQMRKRYMELDKILLPLLPPNKEVSQHVRERSGRLAGVSAYLKKMPVILSMKILRSPITTML